MEKQIVPEEVKQPEEILEKKIEKVEGLVEDGAGNCKLAIGHVPTPGTGSGTVPTTGTQTEKGKNK